MNLERLRFAWWSRLLPQGDGYGRILATMLAAAVVAYIAWKIAQSPDQAVQFAFNGLAVGAVYALLAMGFTIVYSTVWFFDLYYGAAAAIGAYGVFYLRSQDGFGGQDYTNPYVTAMLAAVTAGVVAWALYEAFFHKLRPRYGARVLYAVGGLVWEPGRRSRGLYGNRSELYRHHERHSQSGNRGPSSVGRGLGRVPRRSAGAP